jgi:hypothetical protein
LAKKFKVAGIIGTLAPKKQGYELKVKDSQGQQVTEAKAFNHRFHTNKTSLQANS